MKAGGDSLDICNLGCKLGTSTTSVLGHYKIRLVSMRQVPLERHINIAINGPFLVEVANPERAIYSNVDITLHRHLPHCFPSSKILTTFLPSLASARVAVIGPKRELKDIYIETNRSRGSGSSPDSRSCHCTPRLGLSEHVACRERN